MQTLGKNESVSLNSIAHMLRIMKKYVGKKWYVFHAPDKPAKQEVNFVVIRNFMMFLTLLVKV